MKNLLPFVVCSFLFFSSKGQIIDRSHVDSLLFKRNDTIFLRASHMAFNGSIRDEKSEYKLYQEGILYTDTAFAPSDRRRYWVEMIFPFQNDTFTIDSRHSVDRETFKNRKFFYLESVMGKSRPINIDTLKAVNYSQIKIPDFSYYKFYQQRGNCPFGNHRDRVIPYFYGLPNKNMQKLIDEKKVILKSCFGARTNKPLYYCQRHNIEI